MLGRIYVNLNLRVKDPKKSSRERPIPVLIPHLFGTREKKSRETSPEVIWDEDPRMVLQ